MSWRTDPPDPGSGDLREMALKCHDCHWTSKSLRAVVAVGNALRHAEETGHRISYRGVVQDFGGKRC